jgi:hypothetical protein
MEHATQKARLRAWESKSMKVMKKLTKSSIFGKSKKHAKLRR